MPIDYDAIVDDGDAGFASPGGKGGEWNDLFERHPEGGGPFGGRDNAATKLLGFLRAKRVPFDAAVAFAEWWNQTYLDPPMSAGDIRDKIQRGWVRRCLVHMVARGDGWFELEDFAKAMGYDADWLQSWLEHCETKG